MSDTVTMGATEAAGIEVGDQRMLIDGEWCAAQSGRTLPIVNPANERQIGTLADAGAADVERAVKAAADAFAQGEGQWAQRPVAERVAILGRVLDVLDGQAQQIGSMEVAGGGMTLRNAMGFHAMGAPGFVRANIAQAPTDQFVGLPLEEAPTVSANYLRREPVGVVAALPPSNAGYFLGLYKTMCALVTGNAVVLKPSPFCSLGCAALARAIDADPDIPKGVFHLLFGDTEAGPALTRHPLVDKISFTGSAETGRRVLAAAAPNLSRVTLELGGKGPAIVLDDVDLGYAIDGMIWGFLWQSGQACISGSRLLVPESLHDEVVQRLIDRCRTLVIGDPMSPDTDFGPVVSAAQRDKVEACIAGARAEGATVAYGGERPDLGPGFWVQPTILDDVTNDMDIAQGEVFGPVLAVIRYRDEEDALRIANDTEYGLSATVWTTSNARAISMGKRLRAGTVWINDHHMVSPLAPFGGYKNSGMGREFGIQGLEAFTEIKHMHLDLTGSGDRPVYGILLGH
ncbi:MAG TPA: aldehyde dehydrogenase family protein [Solirubrobacteraceae bacterium]|jgi:aldehyde dehydrogenase (NAD+)|nr:aldehyde dehydrogenase family protein [Solirubrobacteraceae bacterium]